MPVDEEKAGSPESSDEPQASTQEPRIEGPTGEGPTLAEELAPLVGEAVGAIFGVLRSGGRRVAKQGRGRLEQYQARRDLERLYQKLGREVVRLVEAGEVDHPGLVTGAERVHRQQELLRDGEPQDGEHPEPVEDVGPE